MSSLNRTVTNNAILDPAQGFDADVFVLDQATGKQLLVGRFASFQWTVRNATEPYMEMNQRIPRLLDGEFQFGWVLERGLIDVAIMENVFGFYHLGREMRPDRSPRMQITFEVNAPNLDPAKQNGVSRVLGENTGEILAGNNAPARPRETTGRYHLQNCKVDSITTAVMAGRSVIATRIEGLCEGYHYESLRNLPQESLFDRAGATVGQTSDLPTAFSQVGALGGITEAQNRVADWSSFFNN